MTPFTALFESLHSAWIDELIAVHPDPKPTLEMPIRMNELKPPSLDLDAVGMVEVDLGLRRAVIVLAHQPKGSLELGISARELWERMLRRAGTEFSRRGIQPRVGNFQWVQGRLADASPTPISRLIWVGAKLKRWGLFLWNGSLIRCA